MNRALLGILLLIIIIVSATILIQKFDFDNLNQNAIAECIKLSHSENMNCGALVRDLESKH